MYTHFVIVILLLIILYYVKKEKLYTGAEIEVNVKKGEKLPQYISSKEYLPGTPLGPTPYPGSQAISNEGMLYNLMNDV